MRTAGLVGASRRRAGVTTTRRDSDARPAPDLVDRNFTAAKANQLRVADITFVPTAAGFLFLAVVLDAWSRKIVGWSMANHLRAEQVIDALEMAIGQSRPGAVIHHSEQGSQYTSLALGSRCQEAGVRPSMGSVGDAYDNAMRESFCATLECELLEGRRFAPQAETRTHASASSRAGIIRCGCILPSATDRPWPTKRLGSAQRQSRNDQVPQHSTKAGQLHPWKRQILEYADQDAQRPQPADQTQATTALCFSSSQNTRARDGDQAHEWRDCRLARAIIDDDPRPTPR